MLVGVAAEDGNAHWTGTVLAWLACAEGKFVSNQNTVSRDSYASRHSGRGVKIRPTLAASTVRRVAADVPLHHHRGDRLVRDLRSMRIALSINARNARPQSDGSPSKRDAAVLTNKNDWPRPLGAGANPVPARRSDTRRGDRRYDYTAMRWWLRLAASPRIFPYPCVLGRDAAGIGRHNEQRTEGFQWRYALVQIVSPGRDGDRPGRHAQGCEV
jgi:hypothetical protein